MLAEAVYGTEVKSSERGGKSEDNSAWTDHDRIIA